MHLIEALAAGIRGAENGTVEIYVRGSEGTFAGHYTTFEADQGLTTPTAALTLDANGRPSVGSIYVNQLVDCIARDSSGAMVCEFVSGVNASAVECITDSFTGTSYADGTTGSSKPITLQELLDKWDGSAGADDFSVVVAGATKTLTSAFASFAPVFNVKDTTYGALGDDSNNDTAAIQAAITAAGVAGGNVYFPPGIYRTSGALTVAHPAGKTVNLFGAGAGTSVIKSTSFGVNAIQCASGSTATWKIADLSVVAAGSNAAAFVALSAVASKLNIERCDFGDGTQTATTMISDTIGSYVTVIGGTLVQSAGNLSVASVAGKLVMVGCHVRLTAANGGGAYPLTVSGRSVILGTDFELSALSGTAYAGVLNLQTGGPHILGGCTFGNTGGGSAGAPWSAGTNFYDLGNTIGTGYTSKGVAMISPAASSHDGSHGLARQVRRYYVTDNTAAISVSAKDYGTAEVRRTNNTAQTISLDSPFCAGLNFTLAVNNDQAGASGNISLGGPVQTPAGTLPVIINANRATVFFFRSYETTVAGGGAGNFYWGLVGNPLANVVL